MVELSEAIRLIEEEKYSYREASAATGIPLTSLWRYMNKHEIHDKKRYLLSKEEEEQVKEYVLRCELAGIPRNTEDLMDAVQTILKSFPRKHGYHQKDDRPSRTFVKGFLKRHRDLNIKKCDKLTITKAKVTAEELQAWHNFVSSYLKDKHVFDLMTPENTANCDETNMPFSELSKKGIGSKFRKNRYQIERGDPKGSLTVLFTTLADGTMMDPYVLYPGQKLSSNISDNIPLNIDYTQTESGWMTSDAFYLYVRHSFLPKMQALRREKPYFLFVDNHSTHINIETSLFCEEEGIFLIGLYANSTHILQPLDVAIFHPLKLKWTKKIRAKKKLNHTFVLTKKNFASFLAEFVAQNDFSQAAINGFRKCGIIPFLFENIDVSKTVARSTNASKNHAKYVTFTHKNPTDGSIDTSTYCENDILDTAMPVSNRNELQNEYSLLLSELPNYTQVPQVIIESPEQDTNSLNKGLPSPNLIPTNLDENHFEQLDNAINYHHQMLDERTGSLITISQSPNHEQYREELHNTIDYQNNYQCKNGSSSHESDCNHFYTIKEIYGEQLSQLIENHRFEVKTANDFILQKVYLTLKPPESIEDLLLVPPPPAAKHMAKQNFDKTIISSNSARNSLTKGTFAAQLRAKEMEEKKRERDEIRRKQAEEKENMKKLKAQAAVRKKLKELLIKKVRQLEKKERQQRNQHTRVLL